VPLAVAIAARTCERDLRRRLGLLSELRPWRPPEPPTASSDARYQASIRGWRCRGAALRADQRGKHERLDHQDSRGCPL